VATGEEEASCSWPVKYSLLAGVAVSLKCGENKSNEKWRHRNIIIMAKAGNLYENIGEESWRRNIESGESMAG